MNKNLSHSTHLDTLNPNHLRYRYEDLFFEVLGGVNTESYMMLRVMLVVRSESGVERDHIDLYNNYQFSAFVKKVSQRTGNSLNYVEKGFKALTDELERYKHELIEQKKTDNNHEVLLDEKDELEAITFLKEGNLLERTNELIAKSGVIGNEKSRLTLFLLYLTRMQENPLHAVIESKQNYLQRKVGELIPDEHKRFIRHLSENAIFYFEENELSNKLILVEDTGTNKSGLIPLLDFQSNGRLLKTVTQKDQFGILRAVEKIVRGPICMSISTPEESRFRNNSVLSYAISEDESDHQDDLIIEYQCKQSAGLVSDLEQGKAKSMLWNIQRMLSPLRVINPYAGIIKLPSQIQNKQLSNAHYLRFIEVVTLFKQYQKQQKTNKQTAEVYIESSIEDIREVNELLKSILIKKCDKLNTQTRTYFERLKNYLTKAEKTNFTNREIQLSLNIPISSVKRYHGNLLSASLIKPTGEGNRAIGYEYKLLNEYSYDELEETLLVSMQQIEENLTQKINGSPKQSR